MFDLIVVLCLNNNPNDCEQWQPYEPIATIAECKTEARRIERMLFKKGDAHSRVKCDPIPKAFGADHRRSVQPPPQPPVLRF